MMGFGLEDSGIGNLGFRIRKLGFLVYGLNDELSCVSCLFGQQGGRLGFSV